MLKTLLYRHEKSFTNVYNQQRGLGDKVARFKRDL